MPCPISSLVSITVTILALSNPLGSAAHFSLVDSTLSPPPCCFFMAYRQQCVQQFPHVHPQRRGDLIDLPDVGDIVAVHQIADLLPLPSHRGGKGFFSPVLCLDLLFQPRSRFFFRHHLLNYCNIHNYVIYCS